MTDNKTEHDKFLDSIPEIEEYKKSLNDFLKIDLSNSNDHEIKLTYDKHVRLLIYPFMFIPKDEFNNNTFYRVRNLPMVISQNKEDISLIRTFSYPLHTECIKNGRVNKKYTSAFYCSDYPSTAMQESKQRDDQMGFLGIWKPNVDKNILVSCFLSKLIKSNNPMFETGTKLHDNLSEWTLLMGKHKKQQLDLLNDFLFDRFIYEKEPYPLTSWLSHQMMYTKLPEKPITDGIVYPSIESSLRFCNYAFNPYFADKYLQLQKVIQFKMELNNDGKGTLAIGQVGLPVDDVIQWRVPSYQEHMEFNKLAHKGIK